MLVLLPTLYLDSYGMTERRGISDERAALDEALNELESKGLSNSQRFLSGGDAPDRGDLAVFGVLRSIEGLPTHDRAVVQREGPLRDWYQRMKEVCY